MTFPHSSGLSLACLWLVRTGDRHLFVLCPTFKLFVQRSLTNKVAPKFLPNMQWQKGEDLEGRHVRDQKCQDPTPSYNSEDDPSRRSTPFEYTFPAPIIASMTAAKNVRSKARKYHGQAHRCYAARRQTVVKHAVDKSREVRACPYPILGPGNCIMQEAVIGKCNVIHVPGLLSLFLQLSISARKASFVLSIIHWRQVMSEPTSRHYWTTAERKALLILHDEYRLAWNILTPLFNSWLGQSHGLVQQVLYSQYVYVAHTPSKTSQRRVQDTLAGTNDNDKIIQHQLKQTAIKLGIRLAEPDQTKYSEIQPDTSPKRKRSLSQTYTPNAKRPSRVASDPIDDQPCTPEQHYGMKTPPISQEVCQEKLQIERSLQLSPTLAIRAAQRSLSNPVITKPKKTLSLNNTEPHLSLPLIGFRGYSKESQGLNSPLGFRAGAFMSSARIPICPNPTDAEFMSEANLHVGWTKGHPSSFISITTSCIRAIMKARSPKFGRYLAVLDLQKIGHSGSIFEAKSLDLQPTNAKGTPIKYHSGGEYLIWVRNSSITSLSNVFSANASTFRE